MVHMVWTYILELWESCNTNQHQTTDQFPLNMMSNIHGIYAAQDWLPQHTQDKVFKMTKEELLTKPKQYIIAWIHHTKNYI